jgi:hypothetical protein
VWYSLRDTKHLSNFAVRTSGNLPEPLPFRGWEWPQPLEIVVAEAASSGVLVAVAYPADRKLAAAEAAVPA